MPFPPPLDPCPPMKVYTPHQETPESPHQTIGPSPISILRALPGCSETKFLGSRPRLRLCFFRKFHIVLSTLRKISQGSFHIVEAINAMGLQQN